MRHARPAAPDLSAEELLGAIPDAVVVVDAAWRVTAHNTPAEVIADVASGPPAGRPLWDVWPGLAGSAVRPELERAQAEGTAVDAGGLHELGGGWFSVRAVPVRAGLAVFLTEVGGTRLAERRAAARADGQDVLRRVATSVAAGRSFDAVHGVVCREVARVQDAHSSWLIRYTGPGSYEVLDAHAPGLGDMPEVGGSYEVLAGTEVEQLHVTSRPVVVTDGAGGRFAAAGLRAAVLVPVRVDGRVWGGLMVAWAHPRPRAGEAVPWLSDVAGLLTLCLASAQARAELARLATTDPLTGVANLRLAQEQLDRAVQRGRRHDHPLTLALVDVDHFKAINDGSGHAVGDRVLRGVADELRRATRGEDIVARVGGDEFLVLLDGSGAAAARRALERVRASIPEALEARGLPPVTVSVGLCAWEPGLSREGLHRRADDALHWAKLHGRDAVVLHDPATMEQVADADRPATGVADAERRLRSAQSFWQSALDALPEHVGVLNETGEVIAVNEAWRRFRRTGVGASYIEHLERLAATGGGRAEREAAAGLRDVLSGRSDGFLLDYESEGRAFRLRAHRFATRRPLRVIVNHEDVTDVRSTEAQVRLQSRLLEEVDAAVVATDLDGTVISCNRAAERLFGWRADEALGRSIEELVPAADTAAVAELDAAVQEQGACVRELIIHTRDGRMVPAVTHHSIVHDAEGRPEARVSLTLDVSERYRYERDLEAARDRLGAVTTSMADGLIVTTPDGRISLANPAAADLLGRPLAGLDGAAVREVLYGGQDGPLAGGGELDAGQEQDEFCRADGIRVPVTWTRSPLRTGDGGHVVVFQDASERRRREERLRREADGLRWAARIREALDEDLFELVAQPIVDLRTGAVAHHELLLRLHDGERLVPPSDFLPSAEEHGLMADIDAWVLRRAVEVAAGGPAVHVNVSGQSIGDEAVLSVLARALEDAAVDPRRIVVEVTETALVHQRADGAGFLSWVRRLGCGVALDDFGTGYNGFARLKDLPVDVLKIDRSFVADLLHDSASASVIRAVVGIADDLGIATVAEGIEDQETLDRVCKLGVHFGQGFHLGLPTRLSERDRA